MVGHVYRRVLEASNVSAVLKVSLGSVVKVRVQFSDHYMYIHFCFSFLLYDSQVLVTSVKFPEECFLKLSTGKSYKVV